MKRIITAAALALAASAAAVPTAGAVTGGDTSSDVNAAVALARRATAKFHDVDAALAAGYVPVTGCLALPGSGGMGIHYLNPAYARDPRIVADEPEMLLYAPTADGGRRLVGVEYFRADADQDLSTDGDRPSFHGIPFDGPMPGHTPSMPIHYDLHVWAWEANPTGMFEEWNPNVHC